MTVVKNDNTMLGTSGHERSERDWYATPEECTTTIAHFMAWIGATHIWECAAGDGAMSNRLSEYGFPGVFATDIHPLADNITKFDFLSDDGINFNIERKEGTKFWIVTNPPYGKDAEKFIRKGLEHIEHGVADGLALLMRNEYDCAATRQELFSDNIHYYAKLVLTWRPRWIKDSTGAPRHNYAWYVWEKSKDNELRPAHLHYVKREK